MANDEDASAVSTAAGTTTRDLPLRGASNPDADSFEYVCPRPVLGRITMHNIVATYHRLLSEDPDLTMPMAAIEALIEFLGHSKVKTVYETIDLVKTQSAKLQQAVTNPIALSHGTDLFQQYLIMSLKQPNAPGTPAKGKDKDKDPEGSFEEVRQHLLRNGRLFAARAKDGRERIAVNARKHIYHDTTILTHGGSRVVGTLLGRAAEKHDYGHYVDEPIRFSVIYAIDPALEVESNRVVAALRAKGVSVATVPLGAVSYVMEKVDMVVVGAEAVTADGGVISRLGSYQIAQLAKANRRPFFVAAEQHKFGKTFPLGQFDYSFDQGLLDFHASKKEEDGEKARKKPMENPIDYTPPEYIDSFFADHKVVTPIEVAKEVIDMLM
ncbi:initiation factor 2 subunit family protein [Seiridium cupressi]